MSSATIQTLNSVPASGMSSGMKAGAGVVVFFLLWIWIWVLFIAFRPSCVRYQEDDCPWNSREGCDNRPACPARSLVGSLVVTIIIFIIFWLICSAR